MPFEFVADYNLAAPGLEPADARWGKIASALTARILTAEPRARVVLRALPPPGKGKHLVFKIKPEVAKAFAEPLRSHCEVPEGRWELTHQYFCKSPGCLRPGGEKRWFPKMYMPLHVGHDIERSAPTGRSQKFPWQPNFRFFFGTAARLAGSIPVMAAGCLTGPAITDEQLEGLKRFDWVFVPGPWETAQDVVARAEKLGIKLAVLPSEDPAGGLLHWMQQEDPKLLEPEEGTVDVAETPDATAAAEAVRKRLATAAGAASARIQALQAQAQARAPELRAHAAVAVQAQRDASKPR